MAPDDRPVLFVTNHAPLFRREPFRRLSEQEQVRFALVGGDMRHGGAGAPDLPFDHLRLAQGRVFAQAASGAYRAVIAGISGKVALPAAYLGARRARVPFVLWATIWAHPRTPAHAASYLPLRHIYRDADAIVTYGPHVSAYVRAKGARAPVHVAPQAVDNDFWSAPEQRTGREFTVLFAGRPSPEKGLHILQKAWRGRLVTATGESPAELRRLYAQADVVAVPSIRTRDFLEPWGLVVNEAFNQGVPVVATNAVGAAMPPGEGLLRDGRNGFVVPSGDVEALARALKRLHDDPDLRARLGANARHDVRAYSFDAWVAGMREGLAAVGASRHSQDPHPARERAEEGLLA